MRHDTQNIRRSESRRKEQMFQVILAYADENTITPSLRQIADIMGIDKAFASRLMRELEIEGRITWIDRYRYRVEQSEWEYTGNS